MQKPIKVTKLQWKPGRGFPYCQDCGAYARSEALFDLGVYIVARRYCEECLPTAQCGN